METRLLSDEDLDLANAKPTPTMNDDENDDFELDDGAGTSLVDDETREANLEILAEIEALGGGFVWEPEIFAVTLTDVPLADRDVKPLARLVGVQQIALNAERLTPSTLQSIACIPGLESLVLSQSRLQPNEVQALEALGPNVELVED